VKTLARALFLPLDPLTGRAYLGWGLALFGIKFLFDYLLAEVGLRMSWRPTDYFWPRPGRLRPEVDIMAVLLLVAVAGPFIWVGINLTVRRLRTLHWPILLACFFFVPYANFLLFALLSLKTSWLAKLPRQAQTTVRSFFTNAFVIALGLTIVCMALVIIATLLLKAYGWGLFVGIPFFTGFIPALLYHPTKQLTFRSCFGLMLTIHGLMAFCFLLFNLEGVICLLMAAPIFLFVGSIGVGFGLLLRRMSYVGSRRSEIASGAFLLLPLLIFQESRLGLEPSRFKITSRLVINAPPERVWNSVTTFSELPPPQEMIFRAGLAYPIRAEIRGSGVGAIRHCIFSTGAFVEPIVVWQEPSLLRFTVTSNPPPMRELSFAEVDPPHLHGFLESEQGQFELVSLPGGKTELVGTTWYRHGLWPEAYWRIWSDYIIHTIHMRVLRHIKTEVETQPIAQKASRS
jgi:hypothetical protein